MQELQAHYDGTSEGAWRKQISRADQNNILYKNEINFTFDKYVPKLNVIFNVLEKYGVPLYKEKMVERVLDQIMSPNKNLKTEVNIFKSSHLFTFVKAAN